MNYVQKTIELAKTVRKDCLYLTSKTNASHVAGALSITDILCVLYKLILKYDVNNLKWKHRDRLIFSKGHSCTALYSVLKECGFYDNKFLQEYSKNGSYFTTHVNHNIPGIELSTGSLGHALSIGCGMALAAKRRNEKYKVFVLLSDGELDEGSNWEAFLFAPQHKLDNLTVIIDYNEIQSLGNVKDVLDLEPLSGKLNAFNWETIEIDGHNHEQIFNALITLPIQKGKPTAIIAHTIKGKGVDFMENNLKWHYKSADEDELKSALKQIEEK